MTELRFHRSWRMMAPLALLSLGLMVGCPAPEDDASPTPDTPTAEPTPTAAPVVGKIAFSNVKEGDNLLLTMEPVDPEADDADMYPIANVAWEVKEFNLEVPGKCGTTPHCGHVEILVDGTAGNQSGKDFNNEDFKSPTPVYFGLLDNPFGDHTITLKLVDDSGNDIGVETSVTVNAKGPDPVPVIVTPVGDVNLDANEQLEVTFNVGNFTLKEEGTCDGEYNCGTVHLNITDESGKVLGTDPNWAGVGEPVTVEGEDGEATVAYTAMIDFSSLSSKTGNFFIKMTVHDDDGNAYENVQGKEINALSAIYVLSDSDPVLEITDPLGGDAVEFATAGNMVIPVSFNVEHFTLKEPGSCGSNLTTCGHVIVNIDTNAGNAWGDTEQLLYNNIGAASPIDADFFWVQYNEFAVAGTRSIRLSLVNDEGDPITVNERAVTAAINVDVTVAFALPEIVSPRSGASVVLDTDKKLEVAFELDPLFFELTNNSSCKDPKVPCGHVRLFMDDNAAYNCGGAYNAMAASSPIMADFSCIKNDTDLYAEHRMMLQLFKPDGTPYVADGQPLADWVSVTVRTTPTAP